MKLKFTLLLALALGLALPSFIPRAVAQAHELGGLVSGTPDDAVTPIGSENHGSKPIKVSATQQIKMEKGIEVNVLREEIVALRVRVAALESERNKNVPKIASDREAVAPRNRSRGRRRSPNPSLQPGNG